MNRLFETDIQAAVITDCGIIDITYNMNKLNLMKISVNILKVS